MTSSDPQPPTASDAQPEWRDSPFDVKDAGDAFREECGVFGVWGAKDAAKLVALGLHALQHRGTEAAGIVAYERKKDNFSAVRRVGLVRDNFTKEDVLKRLPGRAALGHNRYSTAGEKGATEIRDVQPLYAELAAGGLAVAHNGNLTNAGALRASLVAGGSIFQSSSDTECVIHLAARTPVGRLQERFKAALRQLEGAFSIVALTRDGMIGVRDPRGVRPLVLGQLGDAWILTSETCALDIVGASPVRELEPGEMVVIDQDGPRSLLPFEERPKARFCVFEYVYFSRPDSEIGQRSVYNVRERIGEELAREAPVEADIVCPVPDSGTPAAIGYAKESGIPLALGIVKNQYVGRTFIEPEDHIRNMGVRLKLNVNRPLVAGKRVVLVDDSVVRGTTSQKIKEMIKDAGAREVHFRVASPPTRWPCYYGVDTPDRTKLLAARLGPEEMRAELGVDSLEFISLDGLYRACGVEAGRDAQSPHFCDACFSGAYPTPLTDKELEEETPDPRRAA